jgi:hypothetical protein
MRSCENEFSTDRSRFVLGAREFRGLPDSRTPGRLGLEDHTCVPRERYTPDGRWAGHPKKRLAIQNAEAAGCDVKSSEESGNRPLRERDAASATA